MYRMREYSTLSTLLYNRITRDSFKQTENVEWQRHVVSGSNVFDVTLRTLTDCPAYWLSVAVKNFWDGQPAELKQLYASDTSRPVLDMLGCLRFQPIDSERERNHVCIAHAACLTIHYRERATLPPQHDNVGGKKSQPQRTRSGRKKRTDKQQAETTTTNWTGKWPRFLPIITEMT